MSKPYDNYQVFYFSSLLGKPIFVETIRGHVGNVTDLVFRISESFPEAVGVYVEHGWNKPTEFIPWDKVIKVDHNAVFVKHPESGDRYPAFVDQPGWIMVNEHLIGRTILDMDGRKIEVVNDVQLLKSKDRMLISAVDISFNGFLRKWNIGWLKIVKDRLISWRYVQPLSMEDVGTNGIVSLSITRKEIMDLPGEDLADALEELSGEEQKAVFSALDHEKAAEVLAEAEPRTQRQLIANLRRERARMIFSEMSVPQLAALLSVLPHDHMIEMMKLLPKEDVERIRALISERDSTARDFMSLDYVTAGKDTNVGELLQQIRTSKKEYKNVSYVYVVQGEEKLLEGVVDLRELVLAPDDASMEMLMKFPVVAAEEGDLREDLEELFAKYHYRMIPVVTGQDHLLGIVYYKDVMKGLITRAKI